MIDLHHLPYATDFQVKMHFRHHNTLLHIRKLSQVAFTPRDLCVFELAFE